MEVMWIYLNQEKEQEKGVALVGGEQRNQRRPDDVRRMHQHAKGDGGVIPTAQQKDDGRPVGDVKREQRVRPG